MKKIMINTVGMLRCCLESVAPYSQRHEETFSAGDKFECPFCGNILELLEEGNDIAWTWKAENQEIPKPSVRALEEKLEFAVKHTE